MAEDEGTRRTANALELQQNSNQDQVDAPMGGHTIQDQDLISVGGAGVSTIEFLFCLRDDTSAKKALFKMTHHLIIRPGQNFQGKKCETRRWKLGKNVTAHQF